MRLRMKAFVVRAEGQGAKSTPSVVHYAEVDGHSIMLGMPLSVTAGKLEDEVELEVMITGMSNMQWVDGSTRNVIKVEQVRDALKHTLCKHDGWEMSADRASGVTAVFHVPDAGKVKINAERRSHIIRIPRQLKMPGRAWLGFNPRSGAYLAGLDSFADLYVREIRRPNKG